MAENSITCPVCGLEEVFGDRGETPPPLHEVGKFRCDGCQARHVFGKLVPRVVIEPWEDGHGIRWVRFRIQRHVTFEELFVFDLDPEMAVIFAKNVLSIIIP